MWFVLLCIDDCIGAGSAKSALVFFCCRNALTRGTKLERPPVSEKKRLTLCNANRGLLASCRWTSWRPMQPVWPVQRRESTRRELPERLEALPAGLPAERLLQEHFGHPFSYTR